MHPAFSVLIFTVVSGAGYGLIFLTVLCHLLGLSVMQDKTLLLTSAILATVLISAGLLASTLHLTNPKNAWRAFSRFITSWLSREAVFAVLYYPFLLVYLLGVWLMDGQLNALYTAAAALVLILAIVTLFSTSMIYASLKTISQWNNALTPLSYITLGLMSGSLILLAIQTLITGQVASELLNLTYGLLVLGALVKIIYFFWIGKPSGSTIKTATGFTQASVRLLDQGHSSNGFLNNEFGYTVAANKLLRLRIVTVITAFLLPLVLLAFAHSAVLVIASLLCLAGLLAERWLFFAEARHVVRLFQAEQKV
jgi:DMSO reductase anchor subunit